MALRLEEKRYDGIRNLDDQSDDRFSVKVNGRDLDTCLNIVGHSPDGFAWGYGGSGPAQLAFAILHDMYGKKFAMSHYQTFKWDVIAKLHIDKDFSLTGKEVENWRKEKGFES